MELAGNRVRSGLDGTGTGTVADTGSGTDTGTGTGTGMGRGLGLDDWIRTGRDGKGTGKETGSTAWNGTRVRKRNARDNLSLGLCKGVPLGSPSVTSR